MTFRGKSVTFDPDSAVLFFVCSPVFGWRHIYGNTLTGCRWEGNTFHRRHISGMPRSWRESRPVSPERMAEQRPGTTCKSGSRHPTVDKLDRYYRPVQYSSHYRNCSSAFGSAFLSPGADVRPFWADQPLSNTSLKCARFPSSSRTTVAS